MSVEESIIFIVVQFGIIALVWFLARTASKAEVKTLRHKVKNLVFAIKLAALTGKFEDLKDLNWSELDEDAAEEADEEDRFPKI